MKEIILGSTGIKTPQNAFGGLPIQRIDTESAVSLLRSAYDGGMTFFDTARSYGDSEEKIGKAFKGMRDKVFIATKTMAQTPDMFWQHLHESLRNLGTDYVDLFQFHTPRKCLRPDDGTGLYECMLEAKKQGKIRHIGATAHHIAVAEECVESARRCSIRSATCRTNESWRSPVSGGCKHGLHRYGVTRRRTHHTLVRCVRVRKRAPGSADLGNSTTERT